MKNLNAVEAEEPKAQYTVRKIIRPEFKISEKGNYPISLDKPNIFCVIPTLNEELGVKWVIDHINISLRDFFHQTIVVDGYSKDHTREIARQCGALVVFEPGIKTQRGYGNAINYGFHYAIDNLVKNDYDILIMLDADGTYLPRDIPLLIDNIIITKAGMVIGNRFANMVPGSMNLRNRFGNNVITTLLNILYHLNINDSQCGMRALRVGDIKRMRLMQNGMPFATEMIMEAKRQGIKITQVPITYEKRKGEAKLSPVRDGMKIFISMAEHFTCYRPAKLLKFIKKYALLAIEPFDRILKMLKRFF